MVPLGNEMFVLLKILIVVLLLWIVTRMSYALGKLRTSFVLIPLLLSLTLTGMTIPAYYTHLLDSLNMYYEFRSWYAIEFIAVLIPALPAYLAAKIPDSFVRLIIIVFCAVLTLIPFTKPLLSRIQSPMYTDNWSGGVCMQTTGASCGPASIATILRTYGDTKTEAEIAEAAYTYSGGTESWYLARNLRADGYEVTFYQFRQMPAVIPTPSMLGVRMKNIGHFIPVLSYVSGKYIVGDPLVGRQMYTYKELIRTYDFTGFCMEISNPKATYATEMFRQIEDPLCVVRP